MNPWILRKRIFFGGGEEISEMGARRMGVLRADLKWYGVVWLAMRWLWDRDLAALIGT